MNVREYCKMQFCFVYSFLPTKVNWKNNGSRHVFVEGLLFLAGGMYMSPAFFVLVKWKKKEELSMSIVTVKNLNFALPEKTLYKDASFEIFQGDHVGVVGQNGVGKSTLLKILLGERLPDSGEIKWQKGLKVAHLDQYAEIEADLTIQAYLELAFEEFYRMEAEMNGLYAEADEKSLERAARIQDRLIQSDFYASDRLIEQTARGLGIEALGMDRKIGQLSGGQRAKIILAKLLLEKPEIFFAG